MRIQIIALALLLASPPFHAARAQQSGSAEPIARVTLDPRRVVVGQRTTLQVEVLAPNYMTAPPEVPGFQLRNAVTRQLQSININEQRDGATYAGIRFQFAIYPQEPGPYVIADQEITVRYAAEPPAMREGTIALPRIEFQAFIPDAAAELRPFLAANRLTIEQTVQRSSDQLKVGDAVTRTVTIRAEGTPAMLLPPVTFPAIDGLAVYPAQPSLQDRTDGRTDSMSSTRSDSATYMLERPGDYELPVVDVRWWNVARKDVEVAHIDGVKLQVAENPAERTAAAVAGGSTRWNWDGLIDFLSDHWLLIVLATIVLAGLTWVAPGALRRVAARLREHREAYRQSEVFSFSQLRHAAHRRDTRSVYFALLDWLQRFEPVAPLHTVETFKRAARDPALDGQIDAIEQELFAPHRDATGWTPRRLLHGVVAARRGLRRRATQGRATPLPQQLNPVAGQTASANRWRKPAR